MSLVVASFRGWDMKLVVAAILTLALLGGAVLLLADGAVLDHSDLWRWAHGADVQPWPRIEHQELAVRLDAPGGFAATGLLTLSGVTGDRVPLLLDRDLAVDRASVAGLPIEVVHGFGLGAPLHREGRVVFLLLGAAPPDGRVELELAWSGEADHGTEGSDWRGILYVGEDEARMCEQTVFCPQVPLSPDGPGVLRAPFRLAIDAPAAWEVHGAGVPVGEPEVHGDRRTWRFASERPGLPNLVAGRRVRRETDAGATRVVSLLREEHSGLAEAFAEQAATMLADYAARFGPGRAGTLCVFEQTCRSDSSYNWAADGLVVFDRWALGDRVPLGKLAHEVAHLWWGKTVDAAGDGERFLTEGFSEASSWWWLQHRGHAAEAARAVEGARERVDRTLARGRGAPLRQVRFSTPDYSSLTYAWGALVHRYVLGTLSPGERDAFLADYRARAEGGPVSVDDWLAALAAAAPGLAVPWIDRAGDLRVSLGDVQLDEATRNVGVRLDARWEPDDGGPPPGARVLVAVGGSGWRREQLVDLRGAETTAVFDLSGLPGEARLGWVQLDPDDLLPLGVQGDPLRVLDGPRLVASQPAADSEVPGALDEITLQFDRTLAVVTLDEYHAQRAPSPRGPWRPRVLGLRFEDEGRRVVLAVRPIEPGKEWAVPLRGALRGLGDEPPMDAWLRFRTAPSDDREPPRIVATEPVHGATGVPLDLAAVVVEYDETMQGGVGFRKSVIDDLVDDGFGYPEMDFGEWDDRGRVVRFPIKRLEPGVEYVLPLGTPLRDLAGNHPERFDLHFTTVAEGAAGR